MQYSTPQFIEEEGRIVFFLTFRQFFWLVGGGAACFLFYYTLPFWLFVVLSAIVGLVVAAIAFLKIDNESVVKIFLHFIGFSFAKKNYLWGKKELSYSDNNNAAQMTKLSHLGNMKKMIETKK